ncbi:TetR/AcrR family transcriptional regulator [Pimelobacter simplex]|uniref:TetR/AcrR family transcriptional regulator n=1 Tax=Nocardioides simplex TaxID=2045 RepID=UPI00193401F0|nr:TetR/AcrR family transcriptional regulator [Pimelobacter simplex]
MPQVKVTREDWLLAALAALAETGVGGVAVDPIARRLGVTRGSFYWHFKDRAALLEESLSLWEEQSTLAFIADLAGIEDPRTRLEALFYGALTDDSVAGLEPAIVAHAQHPVVGAVLARVTQRRLDYLTDLFAEVGQDPAAARRQAVATYAAYLGWIELRRAAPVVVPETAASTHSPAAEALAHLLAMVTPSG